MTLREVLGTRRRRLGAALAAAGVLGAGLLIWTAVDGSRPAASQIGARPTSTLPAGGTELGEAATSSDTGRSTTSAVAPPASIARATTTSTIVGQPALAGDADPAVVARPIPTEPAATTPVVTAAPPPWAASTRTTTAGYLATDVGCADDVSAEALDAFFADRVGPAIGWDYQHVYPLGGDRFLWLFQDAFLDHGGTVSNLGRARFVHNAGLLQTGRCFTLLHRGTGSAPQPFEPGDGRADVRTRWFWPLGGDLVGGQLWVFWAEMVKDPYDPAPPDGLGWHPARVHLAAYDPATLARTMFVPAPDPGTAPIYGYAVASDETHTYLFGNTFEQNLTREGGFWNGPHSATQMWLARVPLGLLTLPPEYRTVDGWSPNPADAGPIVSRFFVENPMQPRYLDGQWVAATKVDGYWGEDLIVDVAPAPWGPWTATERFRFQPRNDDPLMNSYHAHLLPWRDRFGSVLIAVSNNARNMLRDAWPRPDRYRPMVIFSPFQPTPTTTTSVAPSTSAATTTTSPPTTAPPPPTSSTTTVAPSTTSPPTTLPPTTAPPPTSSTTIATTTSTTAPS